MSVQEQDLETLVDYLDGRLTTEERVGLEIRLANEPELAEAFDELEAADQLERTLRSRRAPRPAVRRSPFRMLGSVLAAAAVLLVFLLLRGEQEPEPRTWTVAAVPAGTDVRSHNAELGLQGEDRHKIPAGTLRGAPGEWQEVPVEDYVELVRPRQDERIDRALAQPGVTIDAGYFVIPLRTDGAASVVVLLVKDDGAIVDGATDALGIAYPVERGWTSASGRLDHAGVHVLPRRNVEPGADQLYAAGFLVPLRAGRLHAIVGLRDAVLDAQLETELRTFVTTLDGQASDAVSNALRAWLTDRGFDVRSLAVDERKP